MKNIAIVMITVCIVGFLIFKSQNRSSSTAPPMAKTEVQDREKLKAIPDKSLEISFRGNVRTETSSENPSASAESIEGKVTLTLKAWNHFLLHQKKGMSKYEVKGETFQLQARRGTSSLSLGPESKMTMEIIDGIGTNKDDYFLFDLSGLKVTNKKGDAAKIRIQLHDKSGVALNSSNVPPTLKLDQWKSRSLSLTVISTNNSATHGDEDNSETRYAGTIQSLDFKSL